MDAYLNSMSGPSVRLVVGQNSVQIDMYLSRVRLLSPQLHAAIIGGKQWSILQLYTEADFPKDFINLPRQEVATIKTFKYWSYLVSCVAGTASLIAVIDCISRRKNFL